MSNRQIEAILKISAKMGNTAALRTLERQMGRVSKQATVFNRANAFAARHAQGAWARTSRTIAPIAAAYGGVAAVRNYAAIERQVGRIGATAEASLSETEGAMARFRTVASQLRMPFQDIVGGVDELVAAGRNLEEAMGFLPAVGKTAQASGADIRDMAKTADAISGSLGIVNTRMEAAFDILAYGGKAGKFELRDMAAELPSLAPAFAALGYKGEEGLKKLVTMLQIVRMETGTSGEAATSFMDVVSKMETETVSNNFKKFGVNIRKEMDAARKSGEDVLEAFTRLSVKAVKGDLSKLPRLFTDKQMLIGMRAIINNAEQGRTLLGQMGEAAGTVQRDFERFSKDAQSSIDSLSNSFDRLSAASGKALVSMGAAKGMDAVSEGVEKATAINSQLEKEGYGWLGARGWWARNGFDTASQDSKAWQGGHRSPQDIYQIEGYRASARARSGGGSTAVATDKSGMPITGFVPPSRNDAGIDGALARRDLAAQYAAAGPRYTMPRVAHAGDELMRPIGAAAGRDPSQAFNWKRFLIGDAADGKSFKDGMRIDTGRGGDIGREIENALTNGGRETKDQIEQAAQSINQAGQEAGSSFRSMLDGIGRQIGAEMAASFKANVGSVTVNAKVSAGGGSSSGRDFGMAGSDIGRTGPQ